jgi:hypothetical protein
MACHTRCASLRTGKLLFEPFKAMQRIRISALLLFAALGGCTATGEAQRPAVVVAAVGKVIDGLAAEIQQRQTTDVFRGLPVVVRNGAAEGAETVVAEMLRTRLTERGVTVEVACPAKCLEITLIEFVTEATGQLTPGELMPGGATGLPGVPRMPAGLATLAPGQASALLATFASRDGNRYGARQQLIAILALAKSAEPPR